MYQEGTMKSELGWHPAKSPFYTTKLKKFIKKKIEKYLHEGGLDQNSHKSKRKEKKKITLIMTYLQYLFQLVESFMQSNLPVIQFVY
jgi:hypothetical protein